MIQATPNALWKLAGELEDQINSQEQRGEEMSHSRGLLLRVLDRLCQPKPFVPILSKNEAMKRLLEGK